MKVGVLIPTRGDRQKFLEFAKKQIAGQTIPPDEILIVDDRPRTGAPDITYRYRKGCEELTRRKCDVILFWEDDDYYRPDYIESMLRWFKENGEPNLIGINSTIYYNIFTRKWAKFNHQGRASMMSTLVNVSALKNFKWCDDSYSYTDMHLWKYLGGVSVSVDRPYCVGIKHGIGLCGGGGHVNNWASFSNYDPTYTQLSEWVSDEAINFYNDMTLETYRYKFNPRPFLSIITRRMEGKREDLFKQHKQSVVDLKSSDFEQIFIVDRIGVGMLNANKSFQYAKPVGDYVYLLDDDDFFTEPKFIEELKEAEFDGSPDVVIFKMKILTGDGDEIYPKPASWESRTPKRGQIGGSCFVVKRWVFERYIHHFGYPSFGDWNFISRVLADKEVKVVWIDKVMAETGKVSRGI